MNEHNTQNKYIKNDSNDYPKEFYSFVDKIEILENGNLEVHLDSIKREDFNESTEDGSFLMKSNLYNIVFETTQTNLVNLFEGLESIETLWFKVDLTNITSQNIVSLFVENNFDEGGMQLFTSFIDNIQQVNQTTNVFKNLKKVFSLDQISDAKVSEIQEALNFTEYENRYVNVYNVGQGNLTALCDNENIPIVYIDMGGGCYKNAYTYSKYLDLCYTKFKTIIFTHWDGDHIWTAHKAYQKIKDKTIIVPRQPLNGTQAKFLKRLQVNNNKILVFPINQTRIDTGIGAIVKCSGTTKNDSGIAVFIDSKINNGNNNIKILLPGDAAYRYINHIGDQDLEIGGLLATHHGANFSNDNSDVPQSYAPHWIIYSFGLGNSYGHARKGSVKAHVSTGWAIQLTTLNGHVSFRYLSHRFNQPCLHSTISEKCSLSLDQGFKQ
jgi:hypothetical protein